MTVSQISPATQAPVSLAEVKLALKLESDAEDDFIEELIAAATNFVEAQCGIKLINQHWRQYGSPATKNGNAKVCLALECWPVSAIDAVTTYDALGNQHQIDAENFRLENSTRPAILSLRPVQGSPSLANGIEIDMICGFGENGDAVPPILKRAISVLVAHWYEFRGAFGACDQPVSIPNGFNSLIASFKQVRL